MRNTLLWVLLIVAAASPAAAQSCATLGGSLDCGATASRPAVKLPRAPAPGRSVEQHGYAETTVSNHGTSTEMNNTTIDSHGLMEFGFRGTTQTPCRVPGYGGACR